MTDERGDIGAISETSNLESELGSAAVERRVALDRRRPTQAHLRELNRLAAVTEILHGWIWETDVNHRFTYMSDSVNRFAGKPPEWHYGKTRQELGNLNADNAQHQKYLRQLDAREKFGPIDFVRYHDGVQLWMRTIGLPQFDADRQFVGYCGVAFEVTAEVEGRQGNRRMELRRRVARTATIADQAALTPVPCVILDVSNSGARLDVPATATVPQRFKLMIDSDGSERICDVVWRRENAIGIRFVDLESHLPPPLV